MVVVQAGEVLLFVKKFHKYMVFFMFYKYFTFSASFYRQGRPP